MPDIDMATQTLSSSELPGTTGSPSKDGIVVLDSGPFDIRSVYLSKLRDDKDLTMPVAAIEALVELLSQNEIGTISEFMDILQKGINTLKSSIHNPISLSAGCDLFLRYIVRSLARTTSLPKLSQHLLSNARLFVARSKDSRTRIAKLGANFIVDNCTILTHAHSRVVISVLMEALHRHVRFRVIVTEGRGGEATAGELRAKGIQVAVIKNSAVGYAMPMVDMCFVGAEGVVENGGIINMLGTYQMAVLAKQSNKPVYVAAETHKFVRLFPLNGMDLPIVQKIVDFRTDEREKAREGMGQAVETVDLAADEHMVDHTPPSMLSAIVTEAGVLTPGAVSEELIKIWL